MKVTQSASLFVSAVMIGVAFHTSGYEDWAAQKKLEYLWASVTRDTTSGTFMDTILAGLYFANKDYLWAMSKYYHYSEGDWREPGHKKVSHGVGGHARAHFEWRSNDYTGLFQKADNCLVRMANAAVPSASSLLMSTYGPNVAIKCLRDGVESANMQFIWQLDGYAKLPAGKSKSCSYFEAPVSNHVALRDDVPWSSKATFVKDFAMVDPHGMMLGVSKMASHAQNGSAVHRPNFPFALVLVPTPALNAVRCDYDNYTSQLLNLEPAGLAKKGQTLYEVHAVRNPPYYGPGSDTVEHIGSLVLDSPFTTSQFGDTELFFRHTFFNEELETHTNPKIAADWRQYLDDPDNYKKEGAGLYWPFVTAGLTANRDVNATIGVASPRAEAMLPTDHVLV